MRCERAVILLATGGVLGRWLARRHAARCPSCAAEAARLRRIARELSVVEPLSAAQRALWTSVSSEPRPSPAWPTRYRRVLLAGSTAAVLLAGVVAMIVAPADAGAGTAVAVPQAADRPAGRRPPAGVAGHDPRDRRPQDQVPGARSRRRPAPPAGRAPRRAQGRRGAFAPLQPDRWRSTSPDRPDSTIPSSFLPHHQPEDFHADAHHDRSWTQAGPTGGARRRGLLPARGRPRRSRRARPGESTPQGTRRIIRSSSRTWPGRTSWPGRSRRNTTTSCSGSAS